MGSCLSTASAPPPPLPPSFSSSYYHLLCSCECDVAATTTPRYVSNSSIEMQLHRIPNRIFLNGSSQVASLCCKQGTESQVVFCGVFDGHGPYGHKVAKKVRDCLPLKLIDEWNLQDATNTASLKESFIKACKVMDKELKVDDHIDCHCSGTTAVTLIKQGNNLVIANVGDSRAVLGTRSSSDKDDGDGLLNPLQLTTDMKPNVRRESERIRLCKGRVFALDLENELQQLPHDQTHATIAYPILNPLSFYKEGSDERRIRCCIIVSLFVNLGGENAWGIHPFFPFLVGYLTSLYIW